MKKLAFFLAAISLLTACTSSKEAVMDETISSRLTELNDRIVAIEKGIDYTNTETEKIQIASLAIEESIVTLKGNDAVIGDEIGEISSDIKKIRDFYAVKVHFEKAGVVFKSQMNKFTIIMPYDVTFGFNQYELKTEFNELLSTVAEAINMAPELNVEVIGHTDNVGTAKYNYKLSEKRAETVANYLISNGVDKGRLVVKGVGFDEPISTNDTEDGRSQNRRVEINIIN
jgi:outer membrane protein OmpA-like peptidoglycan-associated protein